MSVLSTINGIDVLLAGVASIGWFFYLSERAEAKRLATKKTRFETNVPEGTQCDASTHYKYARGFTGSGSKTRVLILRTNPPATRDTCLLPLSHHGPHMGNAEVWEEA